MNADGARPLALPILGLDSSRVRAGALEAVLRDLPGVVRAYVSPNTALAYVEYQSDTHFRRPADQRHRRRRL